MGLVHTAVALVAAVAALALASPLWANPKVDNALLMGMVDPSFTDEAFMAALEPLGPDDEKALVEALASPIEAYRFRAAMAVGRLKVVAAVDRLPSLARDESSKAAVAAVEALKAFGSVGLPGLLAVIGDGGVNSETRALAIKAAGDLHAPSALPALIRSLLPDGGVTTEAATEAIAGFGAAAGLPLARSLREGNWGRAQEKALGAACMQAGSLDFLFSPWSEPGSSPGMAAEDRLALLAAGVEMCEYFGSFTLTRQMKPNGAALHEAALAQNPLLTKVMDNVELGDQLRAAAARAKRKLDSDVRFGGGSWITTAPSPNAAPASSRPAATSARVSPGGAGSRLAALFDQTQSAASRPGSAPRPGEATWVDPPRGQILMDSRRGAAAAGTPTPAPCSSPPPPSKEALLEMLAAPQRHRNCMVALKGEPYDWLIEALEAPALTIRGTAAEILGEIGNEDAVPALIEVVRTEIEPGTVTIHHKAVKKQPASGSSSGGGGISDEQAERVREQLRREAEERAEEARRNALGNAKVVNITDPATGHVYQQAHTGYVPPASGSSSISWRPPVDDGWTSERDETHVDWDETQAIDNLKDAAINSLGIIGGSEAYEYLLKLIRSGNEKRHLPAVALALLRADPEQGRIFLEKLRNQGDSDEKSAASHALSRGPAH
jgi:HEAT repeat protein